jgi:hypothetical protein
MSTLNRATKDELEAMIDSNSLDAILEAVSVICAEKAEHLLTNWQDKVTARDWAKASNLIDSVATRVSKLI